MQLQQASDKKQKNNKKVKSSNNRVAPETAPGATHARVPFW